MRPDEKLSAYLDGELDAAASVELEREMAQNPALRAACERMRELSRTIREKGDYFRRPAKAPRRSSWTRLAPAFAAVLALGIGIGFFVAQPREDAAPGAEAIAAHVRATLGGHLIDVASSDQHSVKPWLSARLPFSPPVPELSQEGFVLAGARLDALAGQPAAVLVYRRRQHVIDVFVAPGSAGASSFARNGFNVEAFGRDGMRYWLVSDLNRNELQDLSRLLSQR